MDREKPCDRMETVKGSIVGGTDAARCRGEAIESFCENNRGCHNV